MLSRFVSLKEQRTEPSHLSEKDLQLKNKEFIFTKLKNDFEFAMCMQAKGDLDAALRIYFGLTDKLNNLGYVKTSKEIEEKKKQRLFQKFPFEIRLQFLCLKNCAYICEEKRRWEEMESLYCTLLESFADCVVLDSGLVVRMLRTLKKKGAFSLARKICEYYLRDRKDEFIFRQWYSLVDVIGDRLLLESHTCNEDDYYYYYYYPSHNDASLTSTFPQKPISFDLTRIYKNMEPSYFITDLRTLLLWMMTGVFYDSDTISFDFQAHVQMVESHGSRGILDPQQNLIFSVGIGIGF